MATSSGGQTLPFKSNNKEQKETVMCGGAHLDFTLLLLVTDTFTDLQVELLRPAEQPGRVVGSRQDRGHPPPPGTCLAGRLLSV